MPPSGEALKDFMQMNFRASRQRVQAVLPVDCEYAQRQGIGPVVWNGVGSPAPLTGTIHSAHPPAAARNAAVSQDSEPGSGCRGSAGPPDAAMSNPP